MAETEVVVQTIQSGCSGSVRAAALRVGRESRSDRFDRHRHRQLFLFVQDVHRRSLT